jgi:hypothetical protein
MIDDVAAGILGAVSAGTLNLDDVGDGFRVPDAVFGAHALASPSKTPSQSRRSRGDDGVDDGASGGVKRRRDAHSQGDLETQQMVGVVGYADDDGARSKRPVRRGSRAAARKKRRLRSDKTRGWSRRSWRAAARAAARAARASARRTGSRTGSGSRKLRNAARRTAGARGCGDEF